MSEPILQNEIAVIGSVLIDAQALRIARRVLDAGNFSGKLTGTAFSVACELEDRGETVDPLTIAAGMERRLGENCYTWIAEAMSITPTAANVEVYARLVRDDAERRRFAEITQAANWQTLDGGEWRDAAERLGAELEDLKGTTAGVSSSAEAAERWASKFALIRADPLRALSPTGFASLDEQLGGGFLRSGLYIIGARPGMGKTTLAINLAETMARQNRPVLFVSLEMSEGQIMAKRISIASGVGYTVLVNGAASDTAAEKAFNVVRLLAARPFYTMARRVTVAEIGRAARQIDGLAAVYVDYLGLIECGAELAEKPRYEQMTRISSELKRLAQRLDLPVIVLCQLNRENMSVRDKRPQLQHLRDSGAIEQDADGVILLHRENYYRDEAEEAEAPEYETLELIVAKNRHGPTGKVRMTWQGWTGAIQDLKCGRERGGGADDELPF